MKKPKNRPIQKKKANLAIIPNNKVAGTEIMNSVSSNRIKIIAALSVTGFLAAAGYSKYASDNETTAKIAHVDTESEQIETFTVDGFSVKSKTVSEEDFLKHYNYAKGITGGLYWKPTSLSVEYGDVTKRDFPEMVRDMPGSKASWTDSKRETIIANKEQLKHELVHFLLGPEAEKWPRALEELIAASADDEHAKYRYQDLDQDWVRMPIGESMYSGSPLANPRYMALQMFGKKIKPIIPQVIKAAFEADNLTFENLPEFFSQFGVDHNILHKGKTGHNMTIVEFADDEKKGFLCVIYARVEGKGDEYPWEGSIKAFFKDNRDNVYESDFMPMAGVLFVPPPPLRPNSHLVEVTVKSKDGEFTRDLR